MVHLHAVLLIVVPLITAVVALRSIKKPSVPQVIVAIGLGCSSMLLPPLVGSSSIHGAPKTQIVLPLLAAGLAALVARLHLRVILIVLNLSFGLLLTLHFESVNGVSYTANPHAAAAIRQRVLTEQLSEVKTLLLNYPDLLTEFSPGRLPDEIQAWMISRGRGDLFRGLRRYRVSSEWHSFYSGLWNLDVVELEYYFSGGTAAEAAMSLVDKKGTSGHLE